MVFLLKLAFVTPQDDIGFGFGKSRMEYFRISGSSKARMVKSFSMSVGERAGTIAPRWGTMVINLYASIDAALREPELD
jgi:hypothetical protein